MSLSATAHEIARALYAEPVPSNELRQLVGDRNRYQRAIVELHRHLLGDYGWCARGRERLAVFRHRIDQSAVRCRRSP